jgi:predicted transposase YbfD/YdcC
MNAYENGKSGEGTAVRELMKQLGLTDKIFTMDALHCQKNIRLNTIP